MACASGSSHTITLSDEGFVYYFGRKDYTQIRWGGTGYKIYELLPTRISYLPKIKQIACGHGFVVCVDDEGFLWSFGQNSCGQLGIGTIFDSTTPQKALDIPPVVSVACGSSHTLIITEDTDLWSCGNNEFGQLCLGNKQQQQTFQQTSFSNISKISLGALHSLFQNDEGEIYSCGSNNSGELGLSSSGIVTTPILIPNLPSDIVQFVCGYNHNLFLDSEGNVYSFGERFYGQLGREDNKQNISIPNIPPIRTISCVGYSSFLIDFEGNLWSFGYNKYGQLGHGNTQNRNVPTKVENLKDIQQISYGCWGHHVLVKDSQNKIFAMGHNGCGQLGTGDISDLIAPKEMDAKYFPIWGELISQASRAKSARK